MLAARSPDSRSRSTWIGCIRSLKHGADKINLSASSVPSCLLKDVPLDDDDNKEPGLVTGSIEGFMEFELQHVHHNLIPVPDIVREQAWYWQRLFHCPNDCLYVFKIVRITRLPQPEPLQRFTPIRYRGFVNVLEDGQAERLFPLLLEPPTLPESNVIPITMVRLPEPFAKLCVHRKCSYFVLPHETEKRAACYIQWPMLGWRFDRLPVPPPPVSLLGNEELGLTTSLSRGLAMRAATCIADHALLIELDSEEARAQYKEDERCVRVLLDLAEQLHPSHFLMGITGAKTLRYVGDKAHTKGYTAAHLVRAFCFADMLRNSVHFKKNITRALEMYLPDVLRGPCLRLLDQAGHVAPSKATVSRWRAVVDGTFMLTQRKLFSRMRRAGGYILYGMSDSSMQHHRDYEHIVLRVVEAGELPDLLSIANRLCNFWSDVFIRSMACGSA